MGSPRNLLGHLRLCRSDLDACCWRRAERTSSWRSADVRRRIRGCNQGGLQARIQSERRDRLREPVRQIMKRRLFLVAGWIIAGLMAPGLAQPASSAPRRTSAAGSETQAILKRYCQGCHSERSAVGQDTGLTLDTLDVEQVIGDAEQWEKIVRRLRNSSMPPAGRPRPSAETYDRVASWLETQLDEAAAVDLNPGRPAVLHRLNRAEYRNAVRDLLALDVDMSSLLPPRHSQLWLRQYRRCARRVAAAARELSVGREQDQPARCRQQPGCRGDRRGLPGFHGGDPSRSP